jgi:hypothetical protein
MQYPIYFESSTATLVSDYNLWNGTSGQNFWRTGFQSYATWQAAGRDTNSVLGANPSWVGAPGNEHLNTGSPAINAGTNLYSLGIAALYTDRDGIARPSSGPWDIGAFEYGTGGSDTTPPSAPMNLRMQ